MTDPIENGKSHSQALYLDGKDSEIRHLLNTLIDRVEELKAEFIDDIDQDCWDAWDEAVKNARNILNNES